MKYRHANHVAVRFARMDEPNPSLLDEHEVIHAGLGGMGWYRFVCDDEHRARKDRVKTEREVDCIACITSEDRR